MRKVYVIQRPKFDSNFDLSALKALGEVEYLLPSAPNLHDQGRINADLKHITDTLLNSKPDDIFITLGGSPLSQMLFGAAFVIADMTKINYGLFSRGRDEDGRRDGQGGSYRIVPVDLGGYEVKHTPVASAG